MSQWTSQETIRTNLTHDQREADCETPLGHPRKQEQLVPSALQLEQLRHLAASFRLLADETRLRVLSLLLQNGELNVRTLCDHLEQSQPAVSHHLALLRDAGLVRARRDGKHNFYRCISERLESFTDITWQDVMAPDQPMATPAPSTLGQ